MYERTYSDSYYDNFWNSMAVRCEQFRTLAQQIANDFSVLYPSGDDENMAGCLKHVRTLPPGRTGVY